MSNHYGEFFKAINTSKNEQIVHIGRITTTEPLQIVVAGVPIDKDNLKIAAHLASMPREANTKGIITFDDSANTFTAIEEISFKTYLKANDEVLLVLTNNGQEFILIDKVVNI